MKYLDGPMGGGREEAHLYNGDISARRPNLPALFTVIPKADHILSGFCLRWDGQPVHQRHVDRVPPGAHASLGYPRLSRLAPG
jgi:hypothetical protein